MNFTLHFTFSSSLTLFTNIFTCKSLELAFKNSRIYLRRMDIEFSILYWIIKMSAGCKFTIYCWSHELCEWGFIRQSFSMSYRVSAFYIPSGMIYVEHIFFIKETMMWLQLSQFNCNLVGHMYTFIRMGSMNMKWKGSGKNHFNSKQMWHCLIYK